MNIFIRQFADPKGTVGRLFGKMMSVSNRKMHKAILSELSNPIRLPEIGFGSGAQLEMIRKRYSDA